MASLIGELRHPSRQIGFRFLTFGVLIVATCSALISAAFGSPLPALVAMMAIVLIALIERPIVGLQIALFIFYVNLQPILTNDHGIPLPVAAALPVIFVIPLVVRSLVHDKRPLGSYTLRVNAVAIWMCAFFGVLVVSTLLARDMEPAFVWTIDFAVWGLAFYVLLLNGIRDEATLRHVIWAVLAAGAFLAAISLFQEATKSYSNDFGGFSPMMGSFLDAQSQQWRPRPSGPVDDPNRYAQILLVLVPLGIFRMRSERGVARLAAGVMTLLIIGGVFLTFSRGAGVALIAMLPVIAIIWKVKPYQIVIAGAALLLVVELAAPGFIARMATVGESTSLVNGGSSSENLPDRSTRSRLTKNLAALRIFVDHPLIGVGPNNFADYSAQYAEPVGISVDVVGNKAHNLYLGLAAETGALGLLTFGGAFGSTLLALWRIRRRYNGTKSEFLNLSNAFLLSLIAYALTAVFLHLSYQRYLWCVMALAGSLVLIVRDAENAAESTSRSRPWACSRPDLSDVA